MVWQSFGKVKFAGPRLKVGLQQVGVVVCEQIAHESEERVRMAKLGGSPALPIKEGCVCVAFGWWQIALEHRDFMAPCRKRECRCQAAYASADDRNVLLSGLLSSLLTFCGGLDNVWARHIKF